jgi:hypothetical protein
MAKPLKKQKKSTKKILKNPVKDKEIAHLGTLIKYSLLAAVGGHEETNRIFLNQANRLMVDMLELKGNK